MALWLIQGADQTSGADRLVRVEAPDAYTAEARARAAGILISDVRAAPAPVSYSGPALQTNVQRPPAVEHLARVPSYTPIVVASVMLRVFAAIAVLGGITVLTLTIYAKIRGVPPVTTDIESLFPGLSQAVNHQDYVNGLIAAGAMFMAGVVLYAVAYLCLAVRDIARNSFRH